MSFYQRENELSVLNLLFEQSQSTARMVVLTGRRRIGKTVLALKHVADKPHLYLFVSRKNESLLCDEYLKEIKVTFPNVPILGEFKNFKSIFQLLLSIAETTPFVLIMDEFQEFFRINPSIYSEIQALWDLSKHKAKIQVLFLGSVYSLMHKIFEDSNEPLFGRADRILKLKPFTIKALWEILKQNNHASIQTLFLYFLFSGGVPKYVDMLLTHKIFTEDAIVNFIFSESSPLLEEGNLVLIEEFGKDYITYFSILELLAIGKTGRGEIESIIQKDIGAYLYRLEKTYDLIKSVNPIDAKPQGKLQKYTITDQFLRFWFRFIYRHRSTVEIGNFQYLKEIYYQAMPSYKGRILEFFFLDLLAQSQLYNRVGSYWNRSGTDEIDLIAINDLKKQLIIAEIKSNKDAISLTKLQHKAAKFVQKYSEYSISYKALSYEDIEGFL